MALRRRGRLGGRGAAAAGQLLALAVAAALGEALQNAAPAPAPAPGPMLAPGPAPGPAWEPPPNYKLHGTDWAQGACASRLRQSPVSLDKLLKTAPSYFLKFHYKAVVGPHRLKAEAGMLTLDLTDKAWGGIAYQKDWYPLMEVRFHGPAEHLIKGFRNPLEMQLVHRSSTQPRLSLIVSILIWCENAPLPPVNASDASYTPPTFVEMNFNANLQNFLTAAPPSSEGGSAELSLAGLDLSELVDNPLVPGSGEYLNYRGSETSPPCLDSVTWFVRRKTVLAADAQVRALATALYRLTDNVGSYRAPMPLSGRFLKVFRLQYAERLSIPAELGLPWGPFPRTDGEMEAARLAAAAREKAQQAAYHAEDFAHRLHKADSAFAKALQHDLQLPTDPPELARTLFHNQTVRAFRAAVTDAARRVQRVVDAAFRAEADKLHNETQRQSRIADAMLEGLLLRRR